MALLLLVASGCSFALARPPPARLERPHEPVECSSERGVPTLDLAAALFSAYVAASAASQMKCKPGNFMCSEDFNKGALVAGLVGAAVWGTAAVRGYGAARRCDETRDLQVRCVGGEPLTCQALREGWRPKPPDTGGASQP
jgi:hypothetical protein